MSRVLTARRSAPRKSLASVLPQYLVMLQGANRPTSAGRMTISSDGKTLTSEADASVPSGAKTHTTQVFERQ